MDVRYYDPAYVMEIRVTSDGPDGDLVCVNNTVFEFNIQ